MISRVLLVSLSPHGGGVFVFAAAARVISVLYVDAIWKHFVHIAQHAIGLFPRRPPARE